MAITELLLALDALFIKIEQCWSWSSQNGVIMRAVDPGKACKWVFGRDSTFMSIGIRAVASSRVSCRRMGASMLSLHLTIPWYSSIFFRLPLPSIHTLCKSVLFVIASDHRALYSKVLLPDIFTENSDNFSILLNFKIATEVHELSLSSGSSKYPML